MERLTERRKIQRAIMLFAFAYLVSYITRINFGAVVTEMVRQTGMNRASLSAALTGSFLTYGAGQLISGWLGDRVQPKYLVLAGLLATSAMNLLLPFCRIAVQMTVVWCFNGLAQALLWPPIVKLMATQFSYNVYRRASVVVSLGSSAGTVLVYLLSPSCIALAGWRSVFWLCSFCGLLMACVWQKSCRLIPMETPRGAEPAPSTIGFLRRPLILCILLCIVLQGALRDGITTWTPTYIADTYQFSSIVSILTGVVMPVFSTDLVSNSVISLSQNAGQSAAMCLSLFLRRSAVGTAACLAICPKSADFDFAIGTPDRLHARRQPDAGVHASAFFSALGQGVYRFRPAQCLHLHRKRGLHLWHCPAVRGNRLAIHHNAMVWRRSCGRRNLHGLSSCMEALYPLTSPTIRSWGRDVSCQLHQKSYLCLSAFAQIRKPF